MVICGNKIDLEENEKNGRQVQSKEAYELADKEGMIFFEVSAKEDFEINRMFYTTISCLDCFDDLR